MRRSPATRDLTIAELDIAIAECTGISNAYAATGQKESGSGAWWFRTSSSRVPCRVPVQLYV